MKDRKDHSAFGDETVTAARVSALGYTTAEPTRKGYTGYEKDAESSLEFAQARYYSTTHGRYTSVDPLTASASIKNPQTFNRYTYVLNSPYKYADPLGLIPVNAVPGVEYAGDGGIFNSKRGWHSGWMNGWEEAEARAASGTSQVATPPQNIPEDAICNPDHPYWNSYFSELPNSSSQTVDVRKDSAIASGIARIQEKAKPLAADQTPVLTDVAVIEGVTTSVQGGTIVDAYGRSSDFSGLVKPIAYVPLDQGGNILRAPGMMIEERVATIGGSPPETTPRAPQPPGGVFIDMQTAGVGVPLTTLRQGVRVTQFEQRGSMMEPLSSIAINGNQIVKNYPARTITFSTGNKIKLK